MILKNLVQNFVKKLKSKEVEKYITCDYCNGEGRVMEMKCYGGPPTEIHEDCPECCGDGEVLEGL